MKRNIIPYGKQSIDDEDIKAVVEVLKSDLLTQGPSVEAFESAFSDKIGSRYAIAVANGTAALHLSALALNLKEGDKVITTPNTFSASANCVRYCGAEVVFSDIDEESFLLDLNRLEDLLKKDKAIKGVIPVDFAGYPVNTEALKSLTEKYNVWILEDACHAPGGYFVNSKGGKVFCGDGQYSDLSIFSFHPVKHIAAGEGGMITTNSEDLYEHIKKLRTHGIAKKPEKGGWYYELEELGFNYRLSDIHAALGLNQLKKLDSNISRRHEIVNRYNTALSDIEELSLPTVKEGCFHAYHLYVIRTKKRAELFSFLREKNIFCQVHYIPLHYMPYYHTLGWRKGDLPNAENYYDQCLSIPIYHSLSDQEQQYVIDSIFEFFN